jgi:RNA methyltransferase, TrmH family
MPEPIITSLQNPRVKAAAKLRDRRHRTKTGQFLIDGARELRRALESGVDLVEAFVCRPLCESDDSRKVLDALASSGARVLYVTAGVFAKLAFGERAEGVLGVAATPRRELKDLDLPETPLVAVLEGVEKPGNVGAVLRTADGAGVSALIVADGRTDLFNPNCVRASLGTIFTMPVCEATAAETLAWLRRRKLAVYAARVDATVSYADVRWDVPAAVVLGSEAEGLTAAWVADDVTAIRLPMLGSADSLNVSATAAVVFYEALRQRTHGIRARKT